MTDIATQYECGDRPGDAAAYVLGALEPREAELFQAHLDSCVVCRDEVAEFGQVASALPGAVPQLEVPRRLRRRVLRVAAGKRDPAPAPSARTPARGRFGAFVVLGAPGPRLAAGVAAAAIAVTGALGGFSGGSTSVGTIHAQLRGWSGSAALHLGAGHAELVVHGMPVPAAGRIYEIWLQRATGAPTPAGSLFSVTSRGDGHVEVLGNLRSVRDVLVTEEPTGGSAAPTSDPMIVARLT